jgi:hypothetical protein
MALLTRRHRIVGGAHVALRRIGKKMSWQYLIGACILAAGLLLKAGAPVTAIAIGIALAVCVQWLRRRGAVSK